MVGPTLRPSIIWTKVFFEKKARENVIQTTLKKKVNGKVKYCGNRYLKGTQSWT